MTNALPTSPAKRRAGMDRRRFLLTSLAGALAGPLTAGAQSAQGIPRIGYVFLGTRTAVATSTSVFVDALRQQGFADGENAIIEWRFADDDEARLAALVNGLVGQGVKVIVAAGAQSALAAQKATSTIPIVFLVVPDPVGVGLVRSLARPGANITGFTNVNEELAGNGWRS